jgi:hypothetical protein
MGFERLKGVEGDRPGYYPYQVRTGKLAIPDGKNPLLNQPLKSNGLPNWNYDGYLQDFRNDQKHLFSIVTNNFNLLPHMFAVGTRWASINPSCSRVVTQENYQHLRNFDSWYSRIIYLESGPKFVSDQMPSCQDISQTEYLYFLIIFGFFASISIYTRKTISGNLLFSFGIVLCLCLLTTDMIISYTNSSPEMSKYRMEVEPAMIIFIFYLVSITRSSRNKRGLKL